MPKGYHHVTREQRSQISALKAIATPHNKIARVIVHPLSRTIFLIFFRTEVVHKPIGQEQLSNLRIGLLALWSTSSLTKIRHNKLNMV